MREKQLPGDTLEARFGRDWSRIQHPIFKLIARASAWFVPVRRGRGQGSPFGEFKSKK